MSSKVRYSDRKFYFECFDYVSKDTWVEIKPGRNTDDSSRVSAFPKFSAATKSCSYNYSKAIFLIVVLNSLMFTSIEASETCLQGRGPTVVKLCGTCHLCPLTLMLIGPSVLFIFAVTRSWEIVKYIIPDERNY